MIIRYLSLICATNLESSTHFPSIWCKIEGMKTKSFNFKSVAIILALTTVMALGGCGDKEAAEEPEKSVFEPIPQDAVVPKHEEAEEPEEEAKPEEETKEVPEGMYLSELTGLPISEDIKEQRPIAVMIDNDERALPHFGTADADIVYEMMNSLANNRVTRLMCVMKDWGSIKQMGSIRSTRPTNIPLCAEYNAVLCHDGGPFYINDWLAKPYAAHFSGTFSRVKNGKDWEFTEYILPGDLDKNFSSSGYSKNYNSYRPSRDSHFLFADYGTEVDLTKYSSCQDVSQISLPFPHNSSTLKYNSSTGLYDYYEYGSQHLDGDTNAPLSFTNVLLQDMTFAKLDDNGYLIYNMIDGTSRRGLYISGGKAVGVTWNKMGDQNITQFFDENGDELVINPGKTYIGLIPSDTYDQISITH